MVYQAENPSELLAFEKTIISQSSLFGIERKNKQIELVAIYGWAPRF